MDAPVPSSVLPKDAPVLIQDAPADPQVPGCEWQHLVNHRLTMNCDRYEEGRYDRLPGIISTWKGELELSWRKAGPLSSS